MYVMITRVRSFRRCRAVGELYGEQKGAYSTCGLSSCLFAGLHFKLRNSMHPLRCVIKREGSVEQIEGSTNAVMRRQRSIVSADNVALEEKNQKKEFAREIAASRMR